MIRVDDFEHLPVWGISNKRLSEMSADYWGCRGGDVTSRVDHVDDEGPHWQPEASGLTGNARVSDRVDLISRA